MISQDKMQDKIQNLPKICQDYFLYLSANQKSENTIISYYTDLKDFIEFIGIEDIETDHLALLSTKDIYQYINTLTHAKSSISRRIACIKSFYNYMISQNIICDNPTIGIKQPTIQRKVPEYINENETIELIEAIDTNTRNYERDFAIVMILSNTGLRLFELCNIKLSDIKNNILHVQGKGDKHRNVPLNQDCIDAIQKYMQVRKDIDCEYLFLSERKKKISECTVQYLVKKYLTLIDKENLSTHKIRHGFASRMVKNNISIVKIQKLLGHSDIKTTMIYTHTDMDGLIDAVNLNSLNKDKNKS